jgi:malate synthase
VFDILNNSEFSLDRKSRLLYRVRHIEKRFGISNTGCISVRGDFCRRKGDAMIDARINSAPEGFDGERDLPRGLMEFLAPLHREFTPRQRALAAKRAAALARAHAGYLPEHFPQTEVNTAEWKIAFPAWCQDQRNQMTGPADDAELVVKMLNSGAPGVMIDLEDSMANCWSNLTRGIENTLEALRGSLTYLDAKRQQSVGTKKSDTVIWIRPRGLHLNQAGIFADREELISASLFDVATIAYQIDPQELKHPLSFYIPKSESAEEALWWRDLFQAIAKAKGLPADYIKCMALVESHPLAYQIEEFLYNLREHILGLNLGRWDYMASLIHFNLEDEKWVLPDRNTIPHDVPFFQRLRELLVDICHRRGALAIGGMTALYPSRVDAELNERALRSLAVDKKNEADCLMDGAWTGHPDQNEIAVSQFPYPNQINARRDLAVRYPDLRPAPKGVGKITIEGTRAAVRTVIRYRAGVLGGKGASLLDGYMEDLATDRIYRLMIAQRMLHREKVKIVDSTGRPIAHTPELVSELFDEELNRIIRELPEANESMVERYVAARRLSEEMIARGEFDPV